MKKKVIKDFLYLTGDVCCDESKKNLILIHGASINSYFFINQIDYLSKYFNVFAPDLPGRDDVSLNYCNSVSDYGDFILKFAEQINIEKTSVCGISMGGAIVLDILLKNSEQIESGIIINSGARLKVTDLIYKSINKDFNEFKKGMVLFGLSKESDAKDILNISDKFIVNDYKTAIKDFDACSDFDVMDCLDKIKMPVLILTAEEDSAAPVKYGEYLKDNIKNCSYKEIEKSGHLSPIEKPDEVNKEIVKFLTDI